MELTLMEGNETILALLVRQNRVLTTDMFTAALKWRFKKTVFDAAMAVAEMIAA